MAKPKYSLKQNWLWLIIICPVKTENRVQPTLVKNICPSLGQGMAVPRCRRPDCKNNHYSDEFKLVVVRAVISDRLTMRSGCPV